RPTALPAAPDLDHKPPPDRPWHRDLLLPLLLGPDLLHLTAALRALARRIHRHRLVHLLRGLPMPMPAVLLPALPAWPLGVRLRLPPRERRRLPLARPQRRLQLGSQIVELPSPLLVVSTQTLDLGTQLPVLVECATQFVALIVGGHNLIVGWGAAPLGATDGWQPTRCRRLLATPSPSQRQPPRPALNKYSTTR